MKYLMAKGFIGDDERPVVTLAELTGVGLTTWTWQDMNKRRGLTLIRMMPEFNGPRIITEWQMYAIECEMTPSVFSRMLVKRPKFIE